VETFESPAGTDNKYDVVYTNNTQNTLDPKYLLGASRPSTWGYFSGLIGIGPVHAGALWLKHDDTASPTGYHFTGSFAVLADGLTEGMSLTLFVSKPVNWQSDLAAWRLFLMKFQGQLRLALVLGLDTSKFNVSSVKHFMSINIAQVYDIAITYDTWRRFYMWSVDGKVLTADNMPCDWPYIATKIIGSSPSNNGLNTAYVIDNARWYELPR